MSFVLTFRVINDDNNNKTIQKKFSLCLQEPEVVLQCGTDLLVKLNALFGQNLTLIYLVFPVTVYPSHPLFPFCWLPRETVSSQNCKK